MPLGFQMDPSHSAMPAHVTKALDNVGLARPARSLTNHGHEVGFIDEVLKPMEHATACGAGPAMDTSLVDGLASDAGAGIQVGVPDGVGVSVCNPGHLPLASAHVRGGHVDARSQESLLGKLDCEPPSDLFKFVLAVQLGVDL